MSARPTIHGEVEAGFGPVADAFRRNFAQHGEIGAAVAVYAGDRPVVDLWAGHRDRNRAQPWERDTIVPVFSSTKGLAAFVVAAAVSKGLLDYEEKVATYWPEFAAQGKGEITVRQLIDHQAGLSGLDTVVKLDQLADFDGLAQILAAQKPAWQPGTRHGYHAITLGLYQGELIRRVDPEHRTLGRVFAEDIAKPLGLDFFIGLPADEPMERIAKLSATKGLDILRYERDLPLRIGVDVYSKRGYAHASLTNPQVGAPARATRREFLEVELPASNGVGNARSLAKVYGAAAGRTGALPVAETVLAQLAAADTAEDVPAEDLVLYTKSRYHLGFRKSRGSFRFGSDKRAYGTTGLGGSFGFADPATGLGFGYTMNRLGMAVLDDVRSRNLREALLRCKV
ncbi:serine hydrolase domain-containing protein [Nocardia sp. XZ_19_385]|uniref:serine hydrolase domain-containing protein n=1 Tax=Nocardia sp. XZ_19_385 TaxID=2769488 RepID=UPI00189001A0|nr:serine hydrolase domain-containing protein [Nocardia sp. XZ_19_385]